MLCKYPYLPFDMLAHIMVQTPSAYLGIVQTCKYLSTYHAHQIDEIMDSFVKAYVNGNAIEYVLPCGLRHNRHGPAFIISNKLIVYYYKGVIHREVGPAFLLDSTRAIIEAHYVQGKMIGGQTELPFRNIKQCMLSQKK